MSEILGAIRPFFFLTDDGIGMDYDWEGMVNPANVSHASNLQYRVN